MPILWTEIAIGLWHTFFLGSSLFLNEWSFFLPLSMCPWLIPCSDTEKPGNPSKCHWTLISTYSKFVYIC